MAGKNKKLAHLPAFPLTVLETYELASQAF